MIAMDTFPVADRWFERHPVEPGVTLLLEPHVIPLMRCNIWHVRGRDRDLVIDTGMGVASLTTEISDLLDRPVTAVATHGHGDHIGGHHEFDDVVVHPDEAYLLLDPPLDSLEPLEAWGAEALEGLAAQGLPITDPYFVSALPVGMALEGFRQRRVTALRPVIDGDTLDLGDRCFEVLHLPGHSPGSIGLWEASTGTLFSGDAIYDGPLLDEFPDSSIDDYCATMDRLMTLPIRVVHAGHDPSFDKARLVELATAYLNRRRLRPSDSTPTGSSA